MLSRIKFSHHHHCCARLKVHKTLTAESRILPEYWQSFEYVYQTNPHRRERRKKNLAFAFPDSRNKRKAEQTQNKVNHKFPLPILWNLTLQIRRKSCTQKTLALQTSCELHANHIGVEPLRLHPGLVKRWGKEPICFLWFRSVTPVENWGVDVWVWPELHVA